MASRIQQNRIKRFGPNIKQIAGTFFPQNTSTTPLTVANGFLKTDGGVTSVTRTSTAGTYTVQFDDSYKGVIDKSVSVQLSSAADITAQFGDLTIGGSGTNSSIVIRLVAGATPTDVAANANNSVSFVINFTDSSLR